MKDRGKKKLALLLVWALMVSLLAGCTGQRPGQEGADGEQTAEEESSQSQKEQGPVIPQRPQVNEGKIIVGREVLIEDVTDFYYTYDYIGYNAYYQRYRFYVENGKYMFFHETREVEDDYGPATEKNTTLKGTYQLTDEEWHAFFSLLVEGRVKDRTESLETDDEGTWYYLYWKGDNGTCQEFSFASDEGEEDFIDFCEELVEERTEE